TGATVVARQGGAESGSLPAPRILTSLPAASAERRLRAVAQPDDLAVLHLVDVDDARGDLTVGVELDLLRDALEVDRGEVLVDLLGGGVARLDRLQDRGRRVVPL